jgi:hypothetical protein
MRFRKNRLCFCLLFLLVSSGCSSAELDQLRNERDQLKTRINVLEKKIQLLRKNVSEGEKDVDPLTLSYMEVPELYRFIPKQVPLLLIPKKEAQQLNVVEPNTVVEVHDFVDVNGELWLYITIPVFDTPINMKGWIKETDTQLYTLDKQPTVTQPIIVKAGVPVYKVELFNQVQAIAPVEVEVDQRCFVSDQQEDFLALGCAGGGSYIVQKDYVTYPEVK